MKLKLGEKQWEIFQTLPLCLLYLPTMTVAAAAVVLLVSYYPAKHSLRDNTLACFCCIGGFYKTRTLFTF